MKPRPRHLAIGGILGLAGLSSMVAPPSTTARGGPETPVPLPADHKVPAGRTVPADPDSAESCGQCHTAIHAEWKGRKHQMAWDDKIYQDKLATKKNKRLCTSCHIPERVLDRVGRKPRETRTERLHEGVTCVSCHEKDGSMHGPFGAKTDAHGTVKDPLFLEKNSSKLCMSCHSTRIDVVLPVGRDFEEAKMAEKGESCVGCHMPAVERHVAVDKETGEPAGELRKGRSHALLGPGDEKFLASAFELAAERNEGKLRLSIENKAGHGVPGLRVREFHFLVQQTDAEGKAVGEPGKEVISHENGLEALEKRFLAFPIAEGATQAKIVLEHHFMGTRKAEIEMGTLAF